MITTGLIPTRCVQSHRAKRRSQTTTTDGNGPSWSRVVVLTRRGFIARGRKSSTTRAEAPGNASGETPKREGASVGDRDASEGDGEALEEKKRAFWETFWETLEAQRGKAPFMKQNATTAVQSNKETTRETTTIRRFEIPEGSDTFWGRCTIGGLVLAIFMTLSAYSLTHWPTVRFVFTNPLIFLFDPSAPNAGARVEMIKEIVRRLAKPMVRYLAAWCALRSRWRTMWIAFAISCGVPAVEFTS